MDILTKERRSWNMSRIRGKDTKPEIIVRSFLHRNGFRFSTHKSSLPGKPDIVLTRCKTVVFVHGCFWHRHRGCKYAYEPKSRIAFWKQKFKENISQFLKVKIQLKKLGWRVIIIWECEVNNNKLLQKIISMLRKEQKI